MKAVLEGTWDEIAAHADELRQYPKLKVLADEQSAGRVNQPVIDMLNELAERHKTRRTTSPDDTDRLIREARAGGMYGLPISDD